MNIQVQTPGDIAWVTIYLPHPAPNDYTWYKYTEADSWIDYKEYVNFNEARDQLTITLIDDGPGDYDGIANGVIIDPSGLGPAEYDDLTIIEIDETTTSNDIDNGSGCFISSLSRN
jgi:hypothetical protein